MNALTVSNGEGKVTRAGREIWKAESVTEGNRKDCDRPVLGNFPQLHKLHEILAGQERGRGEKRGRGAGAVGGESGPKDNSRAPDESEHSDWGERKKIA